MEGMVIFIKKRKESKKEEMPMKLLTYIAFGLIMILAIFTIQNSQAPQMAIQFLIWQFETSLAYTILGSILAGVVVTLLLSVPRAVRTSRRTKELKGEIRNLEAILDRKVHRESTPVQPGTVEARNQRQEPSIPQHTHG
jgi:uncharacterized integral membrane protein